MGEAWLAGQPATLRLRLHTSSEPYRVPGTHKEIVPLRPGSGLRRYVLARPYIGSTHHARRGRQGERLACLERSIGNAQAWFYEHDRTLVLWECFLESDFRRPDPVDDTTFHVLWRGFEDHLLGRFPAARRVITPSWEPVYDRCDWQQFLRSQGYLPVNRLAFVKEANR